MKLTVHEFLSLDGVMQGPGGPDEDRSGGFESGGWMVPFADEEFGEIVDGWFRLTGEVLFGRTTYEMMHGYWPQVTDPDNLVATQLNSLPKHVVSTTLTEVTWPGAHLVEGDVLDAVRALKAKPGGELQVHGSHGLVRTLHDAGLVDEYRLLTFPVVLGEGKRLFDAGAAPSTFTVAEVRTTQAGGIYQVLRPTERAEQQGREFVVEDGREAVR
ncbi:dihydrofolate reductase family protein [Oerskovia flava]|uniref:dihydrofolate reductase family protein n=1 Tax=Oerskovia flava TaxID=2986422 RepID=UPI00223EDC20|nr:dihydrofolate reductase family protein [Oerskovia sp. JB1-3-2]